MGEWMGSTPIRSDRVKPLRIQVDDAALRHVQRFAALLGEKEYELEAQALNRAAKGTRTDLVRALALLLNIGARKIGRAISIEPAGAFGSGDKVWRRRFASVRATGKDRLYLAEFADPKRRAVPRRRPAEGPTVTVRRDRRRTVVRGAFWGVGRRGKRVGELHLWRRIDRSAFPIRPLWGPNVIAYLRDEHGDVMREVLAKGGRRLVREMQRVVDFWLFHGEKR